MFALLVRTITDPQVIVGIFAGIAAMATIVTLGMPLLARDELEARIRAATVERESIRARERAKLAAADARSSLRRATPRAFMQRLVDSLDLRNRLADEGTVAQLRMAGYRGQAPLVVFLFARVTLPLLFFAIGVFYLFFLTDFEQPFLVKLCIALLIGSIGLYAPVLWIRNQISKRQTSIRRAWPDALDLMLICVEAGMSVEAAFRKVSEEIGSQSAPLAEELIVTTAELSYLQERRQAYENLGIRTGIDGVRAVMTSLIQAERYGTPVATALRVMAQENRDQRMNEAERKAAALPPKLTVPMILFFLPVLFAVIIGPAAIQVMDAMSR
jgi:tight adherence protein C